MSTSKTRADASAPKRRRADAERNIASIVDAALEALASDPEVSMAEIARRAGSPVLAQLDWQATEFDAPVDWFGLARPGKELAHEETPDAEA